MQTIKLFSLLSTFDNMDWKEANKYLLGHTNRGTDLEKLYNYCRKNKEKLNDKSFNAVLIGEKVLKGKSTKGVLNLFSRLYKHMEGYLVIHQLEQDEGLHSLLLMKEYNKRGEFDRANSLFNSIKKSKQPISVERTLSSWLISHYLLFSDNPIKYEKAQEMLADSLSSLENVHKEYALLYELEAVNRMIITDEDNTELISKIRKSIQSYDDTEASLVLKNLINLREHESAEVYDYMRDHLESYHPQLSADLAFLYVFMLIRHVTLRIQRGERKFYKDLLELNMFGYDHSILSRGGKIPDLMFQNSVSALSTSQDKEAVKEFVKKYSFQVESGLTSESERLGLAAISLAESDYEEVLKLCNSLKFKNVKLESKLRRMLCIAHAEVSDDDFLDNYLNRTLRYFKRHENDLSSVGYEGHINLMEFIRMLRFQKFTKKEVKAFAENRNIYGRSWVDKKLGQLTE